MNQIAKVAEFLLNAKPGAMIMFSEEPRYYTIRARNERYIICTAKIGRESWYTVVDLDNHVRGPENLVFGFGAETTKQCYEMLARLEEGKTAVSQRHQIRLNIRAVAN